ncbi:MAG: hypothetical protein IT437_01105 [Phycisphaerales bacterium]|nr:hypothetical protein [Phycisphaerales bacterium]
MAGLIDYAGLFPPAGLSMQAACEAYARARIGEHAWVLGRFICPASRLAELSRAAAVMMPGTHATSGYREHADVLEPWRVSAIIDGEVAADIARIGEFNQRHCAEDRGLATVDAVELKAGAAAQIEAALEIIPDDLLPFFEVPVIGADPRGLVALLAGSAAAAKIRTGGVTAGAFPTPEQVAAFLAACAAADVPFKATAGLHHPVRAEHPLTYEPDAPRGIMHGFLNMFLAAAFVRCAGADAPKAAGVLSCTDPAQFHFTEEGVRFGGLFAEDLRLAEAREAFALSCGSCSFDEPIEGARGLGLL